MSLCNAYVRALMAMLLTIILLSGCSRSGGKHPSDVSTSGEIRLVYAETASCVASTHVMQTVLEQQGYKVRAIAASYAAIYFALANGEADATLCSWLPTLHANYYEKTKKHLDNLGPNMPGTRSGLVVPAYVSIDSIDQLAAHAARFKHQIIGIDAGAGVMSVTQKVIKAYHLPLKLIDGSDATMAAALKSAINNHEWVAVTGWTPHWMWARWKLKYLADPKGLYGSGGNLYTLVRKGFRKQMPGAWKVLHAFHWSAADIGQVMLQDQRPDADQMANARAWVKAHPKQVKFWLSG